MPLAPEFASHAYEVRGDQQGTTGMTCGVGGPSVFYGGASLRYRERDFLHDPAIATNSGAEWPFDYAALEPWYGEAERLLGVTGNESADRIAPPRSISLSPEPPMPPLSRRIAAAARTLGFNPSSLPLAITWNGDGGRAHCVACSTSDSYACAIGAKNDLATAILPPLLRRGLRLATHLVARRLETDGRRITAVECADTRSGKRHCFTAPCFILAAGALASPHLVLASGLERLNPARPHIGRYLMRHCNATVVAYFPQPVNDKGGFHKRVVIFDAYFGHRTVRSPEGKLGCIQQVHSPSVRPSRKCPRGCARAFPLCSAT